jgi:hypothetical protein
LAKVKTPTLRLFSAAMLSACMVEMIWLVAAFTRSKRNVIGLAVPMVARARA